MTKPFERDELLGIIHDLKRRVRLARRELRRARGEYDSDQQSIWQAVAMLDLRRPLRGRR